MIAFWRWLRHWVDPIRYPSPPVPIRELHPDGWVDLGLLGRVVRARDDANKAGQHPRYRNDCPEYPTWGKWLNAPPPGPKLR